MQETPSLRDVPLFRHLDDEELEELEELLEPASFEAGETIFEEGGPEERLYVIIAGTVQVHKMVQNLWRELKLHTGFAVSFAFNLLPGPADKQIMVE